MNITESNYKFLENQLIDNSRYTIFTEIVGALSHKWKQPLNMIAIIMQDLSLATQFDELNEGYVEKSENKIMKEVESLSQSINDFKKVIQSGEDIIEISLFKNIYEIKDYFYVQLKNNQIEFDFYILLKNKFVKVNEENYKILLNNEEFYYRLRALDLYVIIINIIKNIKKLSQQENRIILKLSKIADKNLIEISEFSKNSEIRVNDDFFTLDKEDERFNYLYDLFIVKKIINLYDGKFTTEAKEDRNIFKILI